MADPREVDLIGDGLLWLVNRCLFHRVGLALVLDADGDQKLLELQSDLAALVVSSDITEEWHFAHGDKTMLAKEIAVRELLGDPVVDQLLAMAGPEPGDGHG